MSENSSAVVVGANGKVFVGPTTATAPDDVSTDMNAVDEDWTEVGFVSEAGATLTDGKTVVDIGAWQSQRPIRRIVSDRVTTVAFVLREWNVTTLPFALGGGTVDDNGGEYKFTPPAPEDRDERSLVVEWADDEKHYRLFIPKGESSDAVSTTLARTAAADLPITFTVLAPDSGDPYVIFTDDPAFAAGYGS